MNLSFQDSTYTASNKPSITTLKTDLQTIETDFNAHESGTSTHGVSGSIVGTTDTQVLSNKTLSSPIVKNWDGWNIVSDSWAYASATTITVPSGAASLYQVGDKIKLTQTTAKYFVVVSVADTVLTVTGGSDYSVADAAITSQYCSHVENPIGFPQYFNYTPTGISASGVTLTGRFRVSGRQCFTRLKASFTGGITFTTSPTLPIAASASYSVGGAQASTTSGVASYFDSGTSNNPAGLVPSIAASGTVINLYKASDGSNLSASAPITWANGDSIIADVQYEI